MNIRKIVFYIVLFIIITVTTGCNNTTYKVEFYDFDDTLIKEEDVPKKGSATAPLDLTRTGYTFVGWDKNFDSVKEDLKVNAEYIPNEYKIRFNGVEESFDTIKVEYESQVEELPTPTKDNFTFAGWKYEGEFINAPFNYQFDKNITLEAIWTNGTFNEFSTFLDSVDLWISNGKQYRSITDFEITTISYESNSTVTSIIDKENNYYEDKVVLNDEVQEHIITKAYGDRVLTHSITEINYSKYVLTEYLSTLDEFEYEESLMNEGFTSRLAYTKIGDNNYSANGLLKDYEGMIDYLASIGIEDDSLGNAIIDMDVIFYPYRNTFEQYIEISNFSIDILGVSRNATMNFTIKIDQYENINHVDFTDSIYKLFPPKSIETVFETTDHEYINSFESPYPDPHYYKIELETGQYSIESNVSLTGLTLYDIDGNEVNYGLLSSIFPFQITFTIEKGTYYLKVESKTPMYNGYWARLYKKSYTTLFDFDNPKVLENTNTGLLEGMEDFEVYKMSSDKTGKIELSINKGFKIYYKKPGDDYLYPAVGNSVTIDLLAGDTYIIVGSDYHISYQMNVNIIYD